MKNFKSFAWRSNCLKTYIRKWCLFHHNLSSMIGPALILLKVEINHWVSGIICFMGELS